MAVSLATTAFCAVGSCLYAQEPARPRATPYGRSSATAMSGASSKYLADLSKIKYATLESESVFFERLEKESKVEAARYAVSEARQSLRIARRNLDPPGTEDLEKANPEIARAVEALKLVRRNIEAASLKVRQFHDGTTGEDVAIAAGQLDAAPLLARIRRLIKAAERGLRTMSLDLAEAQNRIDEARTKLSKSFEGLAADDARRSKLAEVMTDVEALFAELSDVNTEISNLGAALDTIRHTHFPECSRDGDEQAAAVESPLPSEPGEVADSSRPGSLCDDTSLVWLNRSAPAISLLNDAAEKLAGIHTAVDHLTELSLAAIQHGEQADGLVHKVQDKARQLEAQADKLLEQADNQLSDIDRILTDDYPGEAKFCSHCGKALIRTRKVMDPLCACIRADEAFQQAEEFINQARELAKQMEEELSGLNPADEPERRTELLSAIRQLRSDPSRGEHGVLDQLALALERGKEFRARQFDFYPGEAAPPALEPLAPREFPPMVAYYVARENWHYPDYFEDRALERYGHSFGCAQPVVSYGKFLVDLALLPYNFWLHPPCECQYELGLYRPGDCVPHLIYLPEPDCCAALFEAGVWTGLLMLP